MHDSHEAKILRTPTGLMMPPIVYSCVVSLLITLASAVTMLRLGIPWWAWLCVFLFVSVIAYFITLRNMEETDEGGVFVIVNKRQLVSFSLIAAIVICISVALLLIG